MTAGFYYQDFDIANEQTDARTNKRTDHIYWPRHTGYSTTALLQAAPRLAACCCKGGHCSLTVCCMLQQPYLLHSVYYYHAKPRYAMLYYSRLSNKRDVALTDFENFHPPQNKNPPYTFIDFLDFSTLHSTFIRVMY